jgi:hypothetical protein
MQKWTQSLSVLLAASLAVTTPIGVATAKEAAVQEKGKEAAELDDKTIRKIEKSMTKLSEVLPYLKDYPVTEFEINESSRQVIMNRYRAKDQKFPHVSLYADPKTGEITHFSLLTGQGFKSTYPYDNAKEKATTFMKQWKGADMDGYQLDVDAPAHSSSILFRKMVNGIPFRNDTINIAVNSEGQIQHVANGDGDSEPIANGQDLDSIQFSDPNQAIPKDEAEQIFAFYMKPYYGQSVDGKQYRLLFAPQFSGEIKAGLGEDFTQKASNRVIQFQPKAKEVVIKSKEEGAAFLMDKTGYDFIKVRSAFEEKSNPDNGLTNYLWKTENEVIGSLFFETKTGKIINYQVLDTKQKSEADKKYSEEQALKNAVDALSEFLPVSDQELSLTANRYEADKNLYEFDFTKLHQGIPVDGWIRQAHVDASTGKVTLLDWRISENVTLPDRKNVMSAEEAAKKFLQKYPLKLYYSLNEEKGDVAELVYFFPIWPDEEVDALTGEFYTYGAEN